VSLPLPDSCRAVFLLGRQSLELRDIPLPPPAPGEMVVRVDAATTCGTDVKVYRLGGHPRMLRCPSPFGHELAGTVAALGANVDTWRVGDPVVVVNSASCGACPSCRHGRENLCADLDYLNGAFAEYLRVPARFVERSTYRRPAHLAPEVAALAEPLACVLHGLEACRLREPISALVLGGGPIGQLMIGSLAAEGHQTCLVDANASRRAVARLMGATAVLDREAHRHSADRFDLAIDATGTLAGWRGAVRAPRPGGQVLFFGGCPPGSRVEIDTGRLHYDELTLRGAYHHRPATVRRALALLASGRFPAAQLLTGRMDLDQVEEALHSMMRRQNLKVVLETRGR
jgi:L-iditol 2-dehydrogenase